MLYMFLIRLKRLSSQVVGSLNSVVVFLPWQRRQVSDRACHPPLGTRALSTLRSGRCHPGHRDWFCSFSTWDPPSLCLTWCRFILWRPDPPWKKKLFGNWICLSSVQFIFCQWLIYPATLEQENFPYNWKLSFKPQNITLTILNGNLPKRWCTYLWMWIGLI